MLDDVRNHDPKPTAEEELWISTDVLALMLRACAMAGVALTLGVAGTVLVYDAVPAGPLVAAAAK